MNEMSRNILHCIGNTSLLALRHIVPESGSRILLKLENENPTGSMKDRMALAMIEAAEGDGRLTPGGSVVEYTGGSTGVSLSLICAVKGYPLDIVTSDAFAREKLDHMRILGARLHVVRSEGGRMTEKLTRDMIEAARVIAEEGGGFWTDQMNNRDQLAAYHAMADELWVQAGQQIDGFVQSVGTAASLRGTGEALRRRNQQIKLVAVEPAESPVLSGGRPGAHKIDGIGAGFVVPLWTDDVADQIELVSTEDAVAMALRLAREEGLFAGTSTGANVIAALRLAEQLGPDATVVTVMCDTGMKYFGKYRNELSDADAPGNGRIDREIAGSIQENANVAIAVVRLGSPRSANEGLRLGTVRRPPRGVPKAEFATRDFYDVWLPNLAPSQELLTFAQRSTDEKSWKLFERKYRAEMSKPEAARLLDLLAALSHRTNFSVGCYCENEERCHRSILKKLLAERDTDFGLSGGRVGSTDQQL